MTVAGYPRYESYKDSGEQWLGLIPAQWRVLKLKHLFREKKHRQNLELNCGAISFGEVIKKDDEQVPLSTKASYQEVLVGEFLVNPLNLNYDLKSLRIGLSEINVVVSAGYIVLQAHKNLSSKYFKYLLHRYDVAYMKLLGSGVRQTISFNHIANSILTYPPINEQIEIATFLDEKCAKIDEAIRIKEEQIKLLHERRQILIQQAVTRGLNPDVPMKDSGIDWIGQIPAHWEVIRLRYLTTKVGSGLTPSGGALAYTDEGIPLLRSQNIHFGSIDIKSAARISPQVHDSMKNSQVVFGDVLLNITGGSIGRCHYVTTKDPLNVNQHVCIIRPSDKISSFHLNTLLSSEVGQLQIWLQQQGGGREGINFAAIKEFVFPVPSLQEQSEIEQLVSNLTKKTRASTHIKNQQITALKEYKTTLINAAVTGKIKITSDMVSSDYDE